jgi:hypothetical protein
MTRLERTREVVGRILSGLEFSLVPSGNLIAQP